MSDPPALEHGLAERIALEIDLDREIRREVDRLMDLADGACRSRRASKRLRRHIVLIAAIARRIHRISATLTAPTPQHPGSSQP